MAVGAPPAIALREFLSSHTRHTRRIEIYESDGITRWAKDTTPRLKSGSISVDYGRDERRTLDLVLSNDDGVLVNTPGEFWYDKIIKVFRGVRINQKDRTPRIVIISDRTGDDQMAQSFRGILVDNDFGDVRIDTDAATWGDIVDMDIVVGLGNATTDQINLLSQAYRSGKAVFVQDADAYNWIVQTYGAGNVTSYPAWRGGGVIDKVENSTHPVSIGWQPFRPYLDQVTNYIANPVPSSAASWVTSPGETISYVTNIPGRDSAIKLTDPVGAGGGYVHTSSNYAGDTALPFFNDYIAVGIDIYPFAALTAASMRIVIRVLDASNNVIQTQTFSTPVPMGGWSRVVAYTRRTDDSPNANRVQVLVWPSNSTPVGDQFAIANAIMVFDADKDRALQQVQDGFFSGWSTDTDYINYRFYSTANASHSYAEVYNYVGVNVNSTEWTPIVWASKLASETRATISAFSDPVRNGRAVSVNFGIVRQQFESDDFEAMVISAFRWLADVFQPTEVWECQVGEFMIDRISEPHFPHEMKITGRDYTKKCMSSKYLFATQFAAGMSLESVVSTIAAAAGITKRSLPATGIVVGREFYFDRGTSRWDAMKEIANAYDHEIYFDATGFLTMRPYQDPATSAPTIWLDTGSTGKLSSFEKSTTDTRLYNVIIVTGESSDANTPNVYAVARNDDPNHPASTVNIGERVYQYSSSFIETTAQAQQVANSFLAVHALEEFELSFESLLLPWLDAGDIIGFDDPKKDANDPTTFLLSTLTIDLELKPMSGSAKRVTAVI